MNQTSANASFSTDSSLPAYLYCFIISPSTYIFMGFLLVYLLLLIPLCISILCYACEQWTKPSSTSSHTDSFTYHVVSTELVGVAGCITCFVGVCLKDLFILEVGVCVASFILQGETLFNVLTCVERYLAVVHPIFYLSLKNERGIKVRNICIGCVWLICCMGMSLLAINLFSQMDLCVLICAVLIVSFCSVSVLCVLIRPGPGDQNGDKEKVDQMKQKAFYTIVTILGVLVLRFSWGLGRVVAYLSQDQHTCIIMTCSFWFYLPSSLVLPVLFLQRKGVLMCCN